MKTIELVEKFQGVVNGEPSPREPVEPAPKVALMRYHLLIEELGELSLALANGDRVAALDALCDLQYVLDGAVLTWGLLPYWDPEDLRKTFSAPPEDATEDDISLAHVMLLLRSLGELPEADTPEQMLRAFLSLQHILRSTVHVLGFSEVWEEAFGRVHASNMSKFEEGRALLGPGGRVLKGREYRPVQLEDLV